VATALTSWLPDPMILGLTYSKAEVPESYAAGDSMIIKPITCPSFSPAEASRYAQSQILIA
jgi:hypothetical protein